PSTPCRRRPSPAALRLRPPRRRRRRAAARRRSAPPRPGREAEMKGSDKAVLLGVVMAVILGFFFFTVLAPKRDKASQLGKDVSSMKGQLAQEPQVAQYGEDARSHFPAYYARLVVMGKAVPDSADTSSLLVQLSAIAHRTDVQFQGISLAEESSAASAAAGAGSSSASTSSSTSSSTPSTAPSGSSPPSSGTSTTATPPSGSSSTSSS